MKSSEAKVLKLFNNFYVFRIRHLNRCLKKSKIILNTKKNKCEIYIIFLCQKWSNIKYLFHEYTIENTVLKPLSD